MGGHAGVGQLLPVIAIDGLRGQALLFAEVVGEDPGARALLPVHKAQAGPGNIGKFFDAQGVALLQHQALLAAYAAQQLHAPLGEVFLDKGGVVFSRLRVQQVAAGGMGLAPADGHDAPHGTHMGGAHVHAAVLQMHQVCQLVQQRVVAADDHQGVFQLVLPAQKPHLHLFPGLIALHSLWDGEDAVGLHKAGDHAAAPAQGGGHQLIPHIAHPYPDKFLVLQARNHRPGQGGHGRGCRGGAGFQPVFDQGL